jgi:diguanylate cyclase (GGDEF)-like protein/PAS domain S-box-containing protein
MTHDVSLTGPVANLHGVYIALLKDERLWGDDAVAGLRLVAELCGTALGTARCSVWLMNPEGTAVACSVLCERQVCVTEPSVLLHRRDHPTYFYSLDNERVIAVHDVAVDARTLSFSSYFANHQIGAMLDATLRSEGKTTGVICWEHLGAARHWSVEEETFAASIADLLSQFLMFHRLRNTEERYRTLFNVAGEALALLQGMRVVDCNETALRMFRAEREDLRQLDYRHFWALRQYDGALSVEAAKTVFKDTKKESVAQVPWRHRRMDGSEFDGEMTLTPLRLNGQLHHIICIRDVTEAKNSQRKILELNSLQQAIFDGANYSIIATDLRGLIHTFNKAAEQMLGYKAREAVGKITPLEFHLQHELQQRAQALPIQVGLSREMDFTVLVAKAREGKGEEMEWTYVRKDGSEFPVLLSVTALRDDTQEVTGFLFIASDITERLRANAELLLSRREIERNANHDLLTGLPNRTRLHDVARAAIRNAQERGQKLALMLLDLDRFKEVNDTLGHAVGDELLQQIAHRLQALLISYGAYLYRLGGDEFAILVTRIQDKEATARLANAVKQCLRNPIRVEGITLELGGSIGVALYPDHGDNSHDLLRCADVAMYKAKQQTAGTLFYEPQLDSHSPRRLTLLAELGAAIRNNDLILHYQPRIDLVSGTCIGCEALVRWQHPTLGLIPPAEFIPLAETSDLIQPLGLWVLQTAVAQAQRWRMAGLSLIVSINLSARNLMEYAFPGYIEKALADTGLPASSLEVEITESTLISDPERTLMVINHIHSLGVRFAIDDFGTGYSSLAYLKRLPIDTLKIDRSFIRDMLTDEQDAMIVRSTLGLAHSFGLVVVAEGVEDEATLAALRRLDCEQVQGYLISKPLTADDFENWLSHFAQHKRLAF